MARRMEFEDAEDFFKEPSTSTSKPVGRRAKATKPKTVKPKGKLKGETTKATPPKTSVATKKAGLAARLKLKRANGTAETTQIKTTKVAEKPKVVKKAPAPKKLGRPSKTSVAEKEAKEMATRTAPKKPGRPRKVKAEEVAKKKPGRPRKVTAEKPKAKKTVTKKVAAEIKHRRPGRPRKVEVKHDIEETKLRRVKKVTGRKAAVEKAKAKARVTKEGKIDGRGKYVRSEATKRKISLALKKAHREGRHSGNLKHGKFSKASKLKARKGGKVAKATRGSKVFKTAKTVHGKGHYKRTARHANAIRTGHAEKKAIVSHGRAKAYDIASRLPLTEKNMDAIKKARKTHKPVAAKATRKSTKKAAPAKATRAVKKTSTKVAKKAAPAAKGKGHYARTASHGHAIRHGHARKEALKAGRKVYDIATRKRVKA